LGTDLQPAGLVFEQPANFRQVAQIQRDINPVGKALKTVHQRWRVFGDRIHNGRAGGDYTFQCRRRAAYILGGDFAELLDLIFERKAALFQSLRREMKAETHGKPLQPLLVCEPDLRADLRHGISHRNHGRKITLDRGLREFISAIWYQRSRCLHDKGSSHAVIRQE
jgi:hypothetical protein